MPRRQVEEDPVSHERWLVSYADFITLLFAFFVVMYSISQVNQGKYKVLSETLTQAFTSSRLDAGKVQPDLTLDPFQVGEIAQSNPLNVVELEQPLIRQDGTDQQDRQDGASREQGGMPNEFEQLSVRIDESFGDLVDSDMITLRGNEEWLEVELQSSLLFDSGDARLNPGALEVLGGIAGMLEGGDNPVRVEGFTDNVPISNAQFPSNWELSTARAAAVVQLFTEEGLDPSRFAAIGYGEHQPVADNSTPEGRARNRRVVLMISKTGELRPSLRQVTGVDELVTPAEQAPATQQSGIEIEIPGVAPSDGDAADEPAPAPDNAEQPAQGVREVELEDGGLLFTSEGEEDGE